MKFHIIFYIINFYFTACISANIIPARSTAFHHVSNSVAMARTGDTIQLPVGVSDWEDFSLTIPGGIVLQGVDSIRTIIRRTKSTRDFLIMFDGSNGFASELHNIRFEGAYNDSFRNEKGHPIHTNGVHLANGCQDFKVSGCYFKGFANTALMIGHSNLQRGVIYKNTFKNNFYPKVYLGYGVAVYGDRKVWPVIQLGSENAVFIEDNYFYGNRHHIASNNSSCYVFRYNEVVHTDLVKNYAMTDAHGKADRYNSTGSCSFEIYQNDYRLQSSDETAKVGSAIGIRGGNGVIFENRVSKEIVRTVHLYLEEKNKCGQDKIPYQTTELYIWNNEHNDDRYKNWRIFKDESVRTFNQGISSDCPESIALGKHYFLKQPTNYKPFTYPHPLRKVGEM